MITEIEDCLDDIIYDDEVDPIEMILYLLEQHLLEDGIRGKDELQDALGDAWHMMRKAFEINLRRKLMEGKSNERQTKC